MADEGRVGRVGRLAVLVALFHPLTRADGPLQVLEQELSRFFVGHSFTIRNFYRGNHLHYGNDGQLLDRAEKGYWSRDGMVEFSSVKLSRDNKLVMQGERTCVLLDRDHGEFTNVRTGDRIQIEVQLGVDQRTVKTVIPLLQQVLLSSRDHLPDLVPSYWRNCISREVDRRDRNSPWECVVAGKEPVPDFEGKRIIWDLQSPDTSLHTGLKHYLMRHRVGYWPEPGIKAPELISDPDPVFLWQQLRTRLGAMTLVLAFTVGEDGQAHDLLIVSPIGMGIDDDAAQAVSHWRFKPAKCGDKPCKAHARVYFDIAPTSGTSPTYH